MRRRRDSRRLLVLLVGAALLACVGAGCRRRSSFAGAPVFIVSIDTLRADHLPVYGARGIETPAIDALARGGIVYETAISHVPLTLPSHASLFTGLLPFQNGVRDNLGYPLSPSHPTVAALLRAKGYATGGAVSAVVLDRTTGIAEGFDSWDDSVEAAASGAPVALAQVRRPGIESERRLEDWIDRTGGADAKPIFGFLHLYEPHAPCVPPEPFATRYAGRPYDGAIAEADRVLGLFLAHLKARGLYESAVVILLSDHGEGLGDHGEQEHGVFLYREAIRVPLILKLPAGRDAGRRVRAAVGLVDILPTLAALLDLAVPEALPGAAVWPSPPPAGSRRIYSETLFPRLHFGWSDLASLTDGTSHYVHAPRDELYDWSSDPAERRDLAGGTPPVFRAMRAALEAMPRPLEPPGASDPETVRKLASLGYVGAGAGAAPAAGSGLPDPKDRIELVARLSQAGRLAAGGRTEEAIAMLQRIVQENPEMADARQMLAETLLESGRAEEAWTQLLEVNRDHPGIAPVMLSLADLALARGQPREARRYALAAQAVGSADAEPALASIALAEGNLSEARSRAESAVRARPASRAARLLLARVEAGAGNPAGALATLDDLARLEAEGPGPHPRPLRDASFLRGDMLARLGQTESARGAFAAEIHDFPENPRGYTGLALLEASGGDSTAARQTLASLLTHARSPDSWFLAARVYELLGDRAAAARTRAQASRRFPGVHERSAPAPPA